MTEKSSESYTGIRLCYLSDARVIDLHTSTDMKLLPLVCLLIWPGITSANDDGFVSVSEGSDAVLPCSLSSKQNIEKMVFDWKKDQKEVFFYDRGQHYNNGRAGQDKQFEGRVSHFEDELKFGNASIRIHRAQVSDNGSYICTFPDRQKSNIMLFVDPHSGHLNDRTDESIQGAARKPNVETLNEGNDEAQLKCEVIGASPKPEVVWWDSSGNIIPAEEPLVSQRGSFFDIILLTTVTKSDRYRCVATQEEIKHRISSETHVRLNERYTGLIVGVVVLGLLFALFFLIFVVGAILCAKGHLTLTSKKSEASNSESAQLNGNSPSGQMTHLEP